MKLRKKVYIVEGNPLLRIDAMRKFNEGIIEERALWELYLQKQHGDEELFQGPLDVELNFFFKKVPRGSKETKGDLHLTLPAINTICHNIFSILKNIVIKDTRLICSFNSTKQYATNPYTQIIIKEIDNGKK